MADTDVEAWAFDILVRHLTEQGHQIDNVRRPDTFNRSTRDVDFLIEFDGREVAVEVTRLDQERQWWVLLYENSEGTWFTVSSPPRPGTSGGPVINELGRFLGVVSRENIDGRRRTGFTTCADLTALEAFLVSRRGVLDLGPEWSWLQRVGNGD